MKSGEGASPRYRQTGSQKLEFIYRCILFLSNAEISINHSNHVSSFSALLWSHLLHSAPNIRFPPSPVLTMMKQVKQARVAIKNIRQIPRAKPAWFSAQGMANMEVPIIVFHRERLSAMIV